MLAGPISKLDLSISHVGVVFLDVLNLQSIVSSCPLIKDLFVHTSVGCGSTDSSPWGNRDRAAHW